ncbi:MAG: DUF2269 domain-containing protein [Gammaproteobacteria bacterium]|nr:DUF2269 domain-containing protein [Gammaproteobacteria bacterium]
MTYLSLKVVHMLSMVLLFGTGLGSAYYKWMADRSKNIAHIAKTNRHVVLADWCFTTPTIILQPVTGISMLHLHDIPVQTSWVMGSIFLFVLAGACWLPVVWLQIRMRDLAYTSQREGKPLPLLYWRYAKFWFWLGVPAFIAMVLIVILMIFKPT